MTVESIFRITPGAKRDIAMSQVDTHRLRYYLVFEQSDTATLVALKGLHYPSHRSSFAVLQKKPETPSELHSILINSDSLQVAYLINAVSSAHDISIVLDQLVPRSSASLPNLYVRALMALYIVSHVPLLVLSRHKILRLQ
jgi:hypothetical protein